VSELYPPTLVRDVRIVPVTGPAPAGAVDIRIRDGRVSEVAPSLRPEGAEAVHDGGGRYAVPGLWDAHVHLTQWGLMSARIDLGGTTGPDDVVRRVAAHLARLPDDGAMVQGWGHRSATWDRPPTVAELDAVSGGHPVALISGDAHNGWLNSLALRALGMPPRQGAVDEADWFPAFAGLASLPGVAPAVESGVANVLRAAVSVGVVGIVDMELDRNDLTWPARFEAGVRCVRVRGATYADGLDAVIEAGLSTGDRFRAGEGLLTMGPLKVISDGSLNTRTAHCAEPYVDATDPEHGHGGQNTTLDELVELFGRATAAGIEVAVHAIGDLALATALDAVERTGAHGAVEHVQLSTRAELRRMARLGIRASVQPGHLWDDRDVTMRCWPDRAERVFAFRSMLDAGVTLVLGSDAPVSPLDPWLAIAAAVHRSGDDRGSWHPEQAITAREALAASTDGQGTIAVGNRGDVVLLDADPLAGDPADTGALAAYLGTVPVAATFLAGRPTYLEL
jgi:hypothetical protein